MAGNERFEDSIGWWLEERAPTRLPERVLDATFERTRRTRQETAWRAVLRRPQMPRVRPTVVGAAAAVVAAAVLAFNLGLISGPGQTSTPPPATASPSASQPTTSMMWPQSTLEEVQAAQRLADAGDLAYAWQLEDLGPNLGQGGPFREELYRRFLGEELGWEDFHWTLGGGAYLDLAGVFFLRCAPSPIDVFVDAGFRPNGSVEACEPTIDEFRYETMHLTVGQPIRQGPTGIWVVTGWEMVEAFDDRVLPSEAEIGLLSDFIDARVAGSGAQQHLSTTEGADVPLLYATTSGSPYERGEFKPVLGYAWPYGLKGFKVQMFAGDLVVEQLVFTPANDPLKLEYRQDGFGTDIAPTTENGRAVAVRYTGFDGAVTFDLAHPWVTFGSGSDLPGSGTFRLVSPLPGAHVQPSTDGAQRRGWDTLTLIGDPTELALGCRPGQVPADAEALVESFPSFPGAEMTTPASVTTGWTPALMVDLLIPAGTQICDSGLTGPLIDRDLAIEAGYGPATGNWMRLYLFDAPVGSSIRILAIAIVARDAEFERAVEIARSVAESVEFHIP